MTAQPEPTTGRLGGMALGGLLAGLMIVLAPAHPTPAATPELEILPGGSVSLVGGQKPIQTHSVPLLPSSQPDVSFTSGASLVFPRVDLAFFEFVDLFQNQTFYGEMNTETGDTSIVFPLWVVDSDGNLLELQTTLTTGVPATTQCSGMPFCTGGMEDPPHCRGAAWDDTSGELTLVGITLIPPGSQTIVEDCEEIIFVLAARILPGDPDGDLIQSALDNCPDHHNTGQEDADGDGIGDLCDNCVSDFNPLQRDADEDGTGNACQPLQINYQPQAAVVPEGYEKDYGTPFDSGRGYGWFGAPNLMTRERGVDPDQRLDTFAFTSESRMWEAVLPPGYHDVSVTIGDPSFPQGPQRVRAEHSVAFDGETTAAGEHLTADLERLFVADNRLTLEVGGAGGTTAIDYLTAVESADQRFFSRFINFQPADSTQPQGFDVDSGQLYDDTRGFGWRTESPLQVRDRDTLGDPVLDTFVFTSGTLKHWEIALSGDFYWVELSVGDVLYPQGPQTVVVEGDTWLSGSSTSAGETVTLSGRVLARDGYLTLGIGEPGGNTVLNYVSIASESRDLDEDGIINAFDNCYSIANPNQEDADGNGVGDACNDFEDVDGDDWADDLDNCPADPNPLQENSDSDVKGDPCDCAPTDGSAFAPPTEVRNLTVFAGQPSGIDFDTQGSSAGMGTVYDIISQSLSELLGQMSFDSAICFEDDAAGAPRPDSRIPDPGEGFLYLVRAVNVCGTGDYGAGTGIPDPRAGINAGGPCP